MNSIVFRNDRIRLVLLEYIKCKSKKEYRLFSKLNAMFEDNWRYKELLLKELLYLDYVKMITNNPKEDEFGRQLEDTYISYETTEAGRRAIKNGRFPSEIERKNRDRWIVNGVIDRLIGFLEKCRLGNKV